MNIFEFSWINRIVEIIYGSYNNNLRFKINNNK